MNRATIEGRLPSSGRLPPGAQPSGAQPSEAQPLARAALARRKRRDAAIALPLAGVLLFVSPLLDLVAGADVLLGVPLSVLYIFGAWFGLIAATARLSRRLVDDGEP